VTGTAGSLRIRGAHRGKEPIGASLTEAVVAAASRLRSHHHGEQHSKAVAWAGLQLAPHAVACDSELVLLFAPFHDPRRYNEYSDPEHGLRGGELARSMLDLEPQRIELGDACTRHDKGLVSDDPTVGACWDADRLNPWRVGHVPNPVLLSTEQAVER
jgi:uncharacterized protein